LKRLEENILKTLLYYDIFSHPLKVEEIFIFLPENSVTRDEVYNVLKSSSVNTEHDFAEKEGYYYVKPNDKNICKRKEKEEYSRKMWKAAWVVTNLIKRFPFVRAVLITGSLSKNSSDRTSDLDFMIITAPHRLWIARTLLMLFKKIFLFNSFKYFCLNYFITEDSLEIEDKNVFTATEIAHIKGTYNIHLVNKFIESNSWINKYFPNYILFDPNLHTPGCTPSNRRSILQAIAEFFIPSHFANKLDQKLMQITINYWERKYSYIEKNERNFRFRSTSQVSKSHPDSVHHKILNSYSGRLKKFNLQ